MKKSWFWLLLLLLMPHLAIAQTDIYGNSSTTDSSTPLSINVDFTTINAGERETFTVTGGSGTYVWEVSQGSLSKTQGSITTYTAPLCTSECDDVVIVTDEYGNSDTVEINIPPKLLGLLITPGADSLSPVRLSPDGVQEFKVTNSEGPISWTTTGGVITDKGVEGNAKVASYKAPNSEGDYEVYAQELNTNRSVTAFVKVIGGVVGITPENVMLAPGSKQKFRLSGANGEVQWTTTGGYISENGDYTAPSAIGNYEVKAYFDTSGNHRTAYIQVFDNVPVITPASVSVGIGEEVTLEIKGGVSPYKWTATDNFCSITEENDDSSVVTYRCSQSGVMTITVTDNVGPESEAKIIVGLPLEANPKNLYVIPGQTEKVSVTGGVPPYRWKANKGKTDELISKESGERLYSAPHFLEDDVITITDSTDTSVVINVRILLPLSVTPQGFSIKPTETQTVLILGGKQPYTVTATKGVIQHSGNKFSFTAGKEEGKEVITICDQVIDDNGRQQCKFVSVYVERVMNLANLPEFVEINRKYDFKVIGGTGGYFSFAELSESITIDPETGVGVYTAPDFTGGKDTITITDSAGNSIKRTIEIVGYMPPVISPNAIDLAPGALHTFAVSRGEPPYEWDFEGSVVETIDIEGRYIQIAAPTRTGKYVLSVTDGKTGLSLADGKKSGKPATAIIRVEQPLKLTPESPMVYKGEFAKVRINRLGGVGDCDWSSNSLSEASGGGILKKAKNYVVIQPRTDVDFDTQYQITCRDQNGNEAQSTITVAKLQNDFDSDGKINDDEASITLEQFFFGGIDKTTLFFHLEAFIMQQ